MIRLVGLDLDGTLFDERKHISKRTLDAVGQAAARGVFIVPVTGRPFRAVPEEVMRLPGVRFISTTSGACITDLSEHRKIHEDLIENAKAVEIIRHLKKHRCVTMAFIDGMGYVEHEDLVRAVAYAESEVIRHYLLTTRMGVEDLPAVIEKDGRGVEKFTVNFPRDEAGNLTGLDGTLEMLKAYDRILDLAYGGSINLEGTNRTATKGNALRFLAKHLGLETCEMMACGDSGNDVDMLKAVGLPVAMENAADEVRAAAAYITKSNEEDGVACAIEKFVLGKG